MISLNSSSSQKRAKNKGFDKNVYLKTFLFPLCVVLHTDKTSYSIDERRKHMDQQKIGGFLKKLRKEKNLTQEQLAEQLNVSGRTVSRWETGSNMPDISILVELAEFYDVSIPEIIDGERKSETMKEQVKETALKLSDYAETINQKIKIRLFWLTVLAFAGMIAFAVIEISGLDTPGSIYERIASAGLGLDFGMLIVIAMYLSGILGKIKARRAMWRNERKGN